MNIYREINNSDDKDIILQHIYNTTRLSIDDLSLEDALMYDEDREEYYPMCRISLYDLQRSVDCISGSIEYWLVHQNEFRNSEWVNDMKEAMYTFKKEVDEHDGDTYYIVKFE